MDVPYFVHLPMMDIWAINNFIINNLKHLCIFLWVYVKKYIDIKKIETWTSKTHKMQLRKCLEENLQLQILLYGNNKNYSYSCLEEFMFIGVEPLYHMVVILVNRRIARFLSKMFASFFIPTINVGRFLALVYLPPYIYQLTF